MNQSANVTSVDAVRRFAAAVAAFQEEARLSLTMMDGQLRQILHWIENDRPVFWKREIELCHQRISAARVRLHQCRMRRVGDFRPSCIEEVKDLESAEKELEFAQRQIPVIRRWKGEALHEANEYHGRASQMIQILERDLPRLMAMLAFVIDRLEAYAAVSAPNAAADSRALSSLHDELSKLFERSESTVHDQHTTDENQSA